jgi:GT2 family glycosyltransferase
MISPPIISVVILNYQTFSDTIDFIEQIKLQKDIDINILIVDNCSPNNSFKILSDNYKSDDKVKVIQSERNGGYAYGNNFGFRYLENKETDYILISNNDIILKNNLLLSSLIKSYLKCDKPAYLSPVMLNEKDERQRVSSWNIPTFLEDLKNLLFLDRIKGVNAKMKQSLQKGCVSVECLPGSFTIINKQTLFDLGLFDEGTFLYCEERINAVKVRRKGLYNYLNKELSFVHKEAETISQSFNYISRMKILVRSRIYFHIKYNKLPRFFVNTLWLGLLFNIIIYVTYRAIKR